MRADKRSVGAIFDHSLRLLAPLFQRPYVWEESSNWVPLWEAIVDVGESRLAGQQRGHRPHFLGAVVLDQLPTNVGEIEARQIIDGQQRMTTLQLAIAALRDISTERGLVKYAAAWKKLCINDIPLSENEDEQFKVWPTNVDRAHFRRCMLEGSQNRIKELYNSEELRDCSDHRIVAAYQFFSSRARAWLEGGGELEVRMRALYQAVKDDLHMVAIDLDPEDDAQLIFETLNALGAPLLPADLVKNYLFHKAPEGDVERLYEKYWRPLDRESSFWRKIVRQGRLNRPRIDLFLQHYLTLVTRSEAGATHLFGVFRDYAEADSRISPVDHLEQISIYSEIYKRFQTYPRGSQEEVFFYRLEQLDTTTVLPLLLEVFRQTDRPERRAERDQVLVDLESFLVRRAICALTPKNYNRFFLDLLQEALSTDVVDVATIRSFLLRGTGETNRWPDDQEFFVALTSQPLYVRMVRKRLRMVLEALSGALHSGFTEAKVDSRGLQIEHLMPQQWQSNWPLPEVEEPGIELNLREQCLHRLGNLTLLNNRLNPSVSNGPWSTKVAAIQEFSVLPINRTIRADAWDEARIDERTEKLARLALTLWPRPENVETVE